tara:strand:- start:3236 stop:3418 length:183 start_codon:yes stop_codon:yes gene_type:complete
MSKVLPFLTLSSEPCPREKLQLLEQILKIYNIVTVKAYFKDLSTSTSEELAISPTTLDSY